MATTVDRDLTYRVKDLSDALQGRIAPRRLDAVMERLIQAADHLGAAAIGSSMAVQLTGHDELVHLVGLFGQSERALDTAALTLGTIPVHSALDLCAASVLAVVDGRIPRPGGREAGIPQLRRRAGGNPLPEHLQRWLDGTAGDGRYGELELWRDPQTHHPVPKAVFAVGEPSAAGQLTRGSVRVYRPREIRGRRVEQLLGTAADTLRRFLNFGEERFLALHYALMESYASGRRP
jgi:hypothetical protein